MKKSEHILKQIAELKEQAEAARKEEMQGAIEQIRQIMMDNGITLQDLRGGKRGKKSKGTGRTRPPKYADPVSGKTWSGVGRTPIWIREAEEAGTSRDQFLIK